MATGWPMKVTYANGDVYSASDVNDTNGTINLLGASVAYAAAKNKIINGDFAINQRSFTTTSTVGTYGFDRFFLNFAQASGTAPVYSAQTFTAGTAPVAGYESKNFARLVTSGQAATGDFAALEQRIEDVRTFAGQTVTVSFWAKASTGTPKVGVGGQQSFGSGGSGSVASLNTTTTTISASWARYSVSFAVPSVSGKTIGAGSYLELFLFTSVGSAVAAFGYPAVGVQNATIDFWGIQIESGSTATAFQTATGTIQGELAACQRYYHRFTSNTNAVFGLGSAASATVPFFFVNFPQTMRIIPSSLDFSGVQIVSPSGGTGSVTSCYIESSVSNQNIGCIVGTGTGLTANAWYYFRSSSAAGYLGFSSEL